jgi:hypothetical protein
MRNKEKKIRYAKSGPCTPVHNPSTSSRQIRKGKGDTGKEEESAHKGLLNTYSSTLVK